MIKKKKEMLRDFEIWQFPSLAVLKLQQFSSSDEGVESSDRNNGVSH